MTDHSTIQVKAEQHALKMAQREAQNGFEYEYLFTYADEQNTPIYWKIRLKNHNTGDKWIRIFSQGQRGFITKEPDFNALYPVANGKKPLYALAQIDQAPKDAEIWLFEGEQKADLAQQLGVIASTCGGSGNVAATHLQPLADKTVVIWADNDKAGFKCRDELAQALQQIGCKVQFVDLDPLKLPEKGDIVDWHNAQQTNGLHPTLDDLQQLKRIPYMPPEPTKTLPNGLLAESMEWERGHFEVTEKGLFFVDVDKNGNYHEKYISSPILVLAKTRDKDSGGWGNLLQWRDDANHLHTWAVPAELFQTDGAELRKTLASNGLKIVPDKRGRDLLQCYLMSYPAEKMALCVDRVGWSGQAFVLPNKVIGQPKDGELIVYQSMSGIDSRYQCSGTLEQWRTEVSELAQSHSKLVFALSTAFSGQLLTLLEQTQGAGVHYKGGSSKGKTTALYVANSVWGSPRRFYRTWKATGNALDHTAHMHNDGFLGLDEIGEISNPKELGNLAYSLANGVGKSRMSRSLTAKATYEWLIMFLSTGEESLKQIMEQHGQRTKLGQEIRLLDIDVDHSPYGVFDQIDFAQDGAKQSRLITERANQYYGVAGIAWLEYLTSHKDAVTKQAKQLLKQYQHDLSSSYPEGHIQRVANSFAIIAVAGELATQAGITGWRQGRAFEAAYAVFQLWISNFEQVGDFEDRQILQRVRSFFEANGNARFDTLRQGRITPTEYSEMNESVESEQTIRAKTLYRVGYRQLNQQGKLIAFLVHPEQFKEVICGDFNPKKVAKTLVKHKWLDHEKGKSSKATRIQGIETNKPVRMYVFNESVFTYDIEQATNPYTQPPSIGKTVDI